MEPISDPLHRQRSFPCPHGPGSGCPTVHLAGGSIQEPRTDLNKAVLTLTLLRTALGAALAKNRWSGCKATDANQVHCRQTCSVIRPLSNDICFSLPVGIGNDSKPSVHFLLHVESNNMLTEHSFQSKMRQLTQDETERQTAGLQLRDLWRAHLYIWSLPVCVELKFGRKE